MRQQSSRSRQQRSPTSALEGVGSIADALSRLQQAPPPAPKIAAQQRSKFESRSAFRDVNNAGNGGEASSRGCPRPFGRTTGQVRRDHERPRQSESEAVRVAVRVRPMSEREASAGLQKVVSVDGENALSVVDPTAFTAALALERDGQEKVESSMWAKRFSFDRCFGEKDSDSGEGQEEVFDEIGTTVIDQAFSGYNATVFAYGQTGSGKSYTMMGSGAALDESVDPEDHGLIPRICSGIFERVAQMEHDAAFRDHYHGPASRISQGNVTDELQEAREMGEGGNSSLPFNDGRPEHCAEDDRNANPMAAESSSRGNPTAVEDSTPYASAVDAEGAAATATHVDFSVEVSYLEIYNESLRDLFNPSTPAATGSYGGNGGGSSGEWGVGVADSGGNGGGNGVGGGCVSVGNGLRLREDPISGTYVEGLTSIAVSTWDEMSQLLTYGGSERTVAATNANDWSSRSHAVFTLTLRQTSEALSPTGSSYESWEACSSVNLVDLAGSERVSHTGATGLRLQEAGSINRSLAALSDVIKALSEAQRRRPVGTGGARSPARRHRSPGTGGRGVPAAAPGGFVPYRNSVLTRLLKESLGGNSRTVMVACASPCDAHYEETLGTLRYAERAKRIRTRAVANARRGMSREGAGSEQAALVERLSAQVCELKLQLAEAATMSPPVSPALPGGAFGTPGGDVGRPSPGGPAPVQEAGGQGYIYVVDPALQVEIERLREAVADRERVIEGMEMGERHNLHARKLSAAQSADGRARRRPKQGGGSMAVAESGSLSTRSDVSGKSCSSPSSPASTSASASASACSGQLCIMTPPRGGGARGPNGETATRGSRNGQANEPSGENGGRESGMRLLNLNQDPMFSECISFVIREDAVTVVGSAEDADVRLAGDDVLLRHAVINFGPDGNAVLTPLPGARVHVNGTAIFAGAEALASHGEEGGREAPSPGLRHDRDHCGGVLRQDYRVVFGSRHFFRVECSGGLLSAPEGARSNGDPSAVETQPVKIDWDLAQRELRDATTRNEHSVNNTGVDNVNDNDNAGNALVEQERDVGVSENTTAQSEVPVQRQEIATQQPQLPDGANRLECDRGGKGNEPSSKALININAPSGGPLSAATKISGSSETMGAGTPPSPGALPGEISPALAVLSRSEEMSQAASALTPGAPVAAPALETEKINRPEDFVAPQTQDGVSTPSPSSEGELPASQPVLPLPSSSSDPPLPAVTTTPTRGIVSSPLGDIADMPPAFNCDDSMATVAARNATQKSGKDGGGAILQEVELSNTDRDESATVDGPPSKADPVPEGGRDDQDNHEVPPQPPPPLPEPLTPPSLKAGGQNEGELTASSKAIHVNKATLIELQRAREAWRGAEGELERSQEERDELRATLQAVQEQARERRRSDRKEKRELDQQKVLAENRARTLESDRDRLRQMLSKSDEEVADLRGQLQKAQTAAVDANAAAAGAATGPSPAKAQLDGMVGPSPVSGKPSSTTGAALHHHSSRGRRASNSSSATTNFDHAGKGNGGGGRQVGRPSTLPVVPNQEQDTTNSGTREVPQNASIGEEEVVLSGPHCSAEFRRSIDGLTETAVVRSESGSQLPTSIPTDQSGLQQRQAVQPPRQQEPHGQEQKQQQMLQARRRPSIGTSLRRPSHRQTHTTDGITLVVGSDNTTPSTEDDGNNTLSAYASGNNNPTPQAGKSAMGTATNTTTTTTTIVITSGDIVSQCHSSTEDTSMSVEDQREYDSGRTGGGRGSRRGSKPTWKGCAGALTGEGSEEEDFAVVGAAARSVDKKQQPAMEAGEDDMFLREGRAEVEAARRLLERHSVAAAAATATRENDAVRPNVPKPTADAEEKDSTVAKRPAAGTTRDSCGRAPVETCVTVSPNASSNCGEVAETEEANSRSGRSSGRSRSARIAARGKACAGDLYRAALSTHISFIATTAADDPSSSFGSQHGLAIEDGGRKPAGVVGEACRALKGDVAGVRQRLEAIQSKFSRQESMSGGALP